MLLSWQLSRLQSLLQILLLERLGKLGAGARVVAGDVLYVGARAQHAARGFCEVDAAGAAGVRLHIHEVVLVQSELSINICV